MMLQTYGFKVSTAATVVEALRQMQENQFDVLISDLNIERPGDGFTVVNAACARTLPGPHRGFR
jgi:DNA-binding response OmpR family regulator